MHIELGQPKLKPTGYGQWIVTEAYTYTTLSGVQITVPVGFMTDGASSFGLLIGPWGGHYPVAVLVHDYLYWRLVSKEGPHPALGTGNYGQMRKRADLIFREICRRSKVAPLVRFGMFCAIRMFGGPQLKRLFVR